MEIVDSPISLKRLAELAETRFGELVKAVVDVERRVMVVDAELHSDQEALLLEDGSVQRDLWGSTSTQVSPGRLHRVRR